MCDQQKKKQPIDHMFNIDGTVNEGTSAVNEQHLCVYFFILCWHNELYSVLMSSIYIHNEIISV